MQSRSTKNANTHQNASPSEKTNFTTTADKLSSKLKWKNFLEKQQRLSENGGGVGGSGNVDMFLPDKGNQSHSSSSSISRPNNNGCGLSHSHGKKDYTDQQRRVTASFQYQLLMLWHATRCLKSSETNFGRHDDDFYFLMKRFNNIHPRTFAPKCVAEVRILVEHISTCRNGNECSVPHCVSSRFILGHHRKCTTDHMCPVCVPVRKMIRGIKRRQRVECKILMGLPGDFRAQYCSQYGLPDRSNSSGEVAELQD